MHIARDKAWIIFFAAGVTLLYAGVCKRLYDIQLGDKSGGDIMGSMDYTKVLPAVRGGIYDRNGKEHPLASSVPQWKVFIDPTVINEGDESLVIQALCRYGEFNKDLIYNAVLSKKGRYHPIGQTINSNVAEDLSTNKILSRCVGKEKIVHRDYPLGRQMCHIVGVVNSSGTGLDGMEKSLDTYLTGKDGYIKGLANARRHEVASRREETVLPVNGADVFLTLDQNIQFIVETALDDAMIENNSRACWAIVQNPKTGEILAMASRPNFDPERYGSSDPLSQKNFSVYYNYNPGSIMKALTFAAGINEGLYRTNSIINCDAMLYAGRTLQDHVHGDITLTDATKHSSNRAASRVAMALGKEKFGDYLTRFGFGKKTGISLEGESVGILRPLRTWSELDLIRMAIGQTLCVTGIQMVSMYSAIANQGVRMKPYVISRIIGSDGNVLVENNPVRIGETISPATAADMAFMLGTVTEVGGTGRRAHIPGYKVAGKTGTAQMPINGGYSKSDYMASFIGFFPASDPQITILVTFEAPHPNYYGGTVAGPVFSRIGAEVARYLEIPPDDPDPTTTGLKIGEPDPPPQPEIEIPD